MSSVTQEWAKRLFARIKHGDDGHQAWLCTVLEEFFRTQVPELDRMCVEKNLAVAQCRDVVRQFNEQFDRTLCLEAELKQALTAKESAMSQAEHFLQQKIALERELSRIRDASGSVSTGAPGYHEQASAVPAEPSSRIPLPEGTPYAAVEASPQSDDLG